MFMLLRTLSCALLFFSFLYALKNFVMRVASARVFDSRKPLGFRRCHAFFFYALKNFVMRVASARVFDSSARVFDVLESLTLNARVFEAIKPLKSLTPARQRL